MCVNTKLPFSFYVKSINLKLNQG
ncbi:hypothetical protein O247_02747, partial [Staphylococcus aureus M0040]